MSLLECGEQRYIKRSTKQQQQLQQQQQQKQQQQQQHQQLSGHKQQAITGSFLMGRKKVLFVASCLIG